MKLVSVLALILLAGCATRPTMEELETQAFISGDWTAVEKRERMLQRTQPGASLQCPNGYIVYCEERFVKQVCSCVGRDFILSITSGR